MRARIRQCLLTAYGISRPDPSAIDDSHGLGEHFTSLNPQFELRPPVAAGFGDALPDIVGQALAARYPDHPEFGVEIRRPALRRVLEVVERAAADAEGRVEVDRKVRDEVRHVAVPLGLGEMGETHFKIGRRWLDELERKRAQHGERALTVRSLRAWIEEPERRGLDRDVQNLVILSYAAQRGLRFTLRGKPADATVDKLDDTLELREQALPDTGDWARAVRLARVMFGVTASPLPSAGNVAELTQALRRAAREHRAASESLVSALDGRLRARGIRVEGADRPRTARATAALLSDLDRASDDALIPTLARAGISTSEVAMGESLKAASALAEALVSDRRWAIFDTIEALPAPYQARVRKIAASLDEALRLDEHVKPLVDTLDRGHAEAHALLDEALRAPPHPPPPPPPDPAPSPKPAEGTPAPAIPADAGKDARDTKTGRHEVAVADIDAVFAAIRAAIRETDAIRIEIEWRIHPDDDGPTG